MKQFRITSENLFLDSSDDCVLPPDDPVHALRAAQYMGGLGSDAYLERIARANQDAADKVKEPTANRAKIMQENSIKPGTEAWFKLWFGDAR